MNTPRWLSIWVSISLTRLTSSFAELCGAPAQEAVHLIEQQHGLIAPSLGKRTRQVLLGFPNVG